MSIGIYAYTNKTNGKVYVGQSVNIEKRDIAHRSRAFSKGPSNSEYDSLIHRAFRKYGLESFDFEILEKCLVSELDEREIYWIEEKRSFVSGYNLTEGGQTKVFKKLDEFLLESLTEDLMEGYLSNNSIAKKYNISYQQVSDINTGKAWKRDLKYPIRASWARELLSDSQKKTVKKEKRQEQKKKKYCLDCKVEISPTATRCQSCYQKSRRTTERPSALSLAKDVVEQGFSSTGRKYGVRDNTIKKWCVAYGIGKLKHEVAMWYQKNKNED